MMLTLAQARDWLKTQVDCPNWFIGRIDAAKEQCIGIYGRPGPPAKLAIGGPENGSYDTKTICVLVHWGKNADLAEQKAQEVYVALVGRSNFTIGGRRIISVGMRTSEPVPVGADEKGVYEFTVDATFFYEK